MEHLLNKKINQKTDELTAKLANDQVRDETLLNSYKEMPSLWIDEQVIIRNT